VCEKIQARSEIGKAKYGVTMERGDLSTTEWLVHLQEELMDAAVYVERLIQEMQRTVVEVESEDSDDLSSICMDCGQATCTC
jgi:precorrin-2 methylase